MSQVVTPCRWTSTGQSPTYSLRVAATREYQGPITCSLVVKELGVGIFASGPWLYWAPLTSARRQPCAPGSAVLQEVIEHISTLSVIPPCHCAHTTTSPSSTMYTLVLTVGPVVLTVNLDAILLGQAHTHSVCEIINWRANPPIDTSPTHPLISRELQPPRVVHTGVIGTHAHSSSCASLLFVTVAGSALLYSGSTGKCLPVIPGPSCPAQGLAFAAASVDLTGTTLNNATDRSGADLRIALFLGSYSGKVLSRYVSWGATDNSPQLLPGMCDIAAHQSGCAIFKVRALLQGSSILVATAADDRSAALWRYQGDGALSRIHTLGGSDVSAHNSGKSRAPPVFTGRVWDVDLVCRQSGSGDATTLMGAGGEDGTVHVIHITSLADGRQDTPKTVTTILRTENLFDTRGCRAISLIVNEDEDTCEVVASGMDGNVVTCTASLPSPTTTNLPSPSAYTCDIRALQQQSSSAPLLTLRCLTVAEEGSLPWTVCAMDEGYNVYLWTHQSHHPNDNTDNRVEAIYSQVCTSVGARLEGIVGKPSCMKAKWCTGGNASAVVLRLFVGTDRGSLAVVDLNVSWGADSPPTISDVWVLPHTFTQQGDSQPSSSKISALTIASTSNRVAFIESVGRRIGTFLYSANLSECEDGAIEWLPVRAGQEPGEALHVEEARIVGTSTRGDVDVYQRPSYCDAWALVASRGVSDTLHLRQSTRSKSKISVEICTVRIIRFNGREAIVVATSIGQMLYVDMSTLLVGEQMGCPAHWVVVTTPYACASVVSMNLLGSMDGTGDMFMISTSGTVVTAGLVSRFSTQETGGGIHLSAHKLLDLCHDMRAKRLLASTVTSSKLGCANGMFVYSPDSRSVVIQSIALSQPQPARKGAECARLLSFNPPHTTSSTVGFPQAISKSKDLHCVANLVECGPLTGIVAGGEDGSLVVSGTLKTPTPTLPGGIPFTQVLTGGTDSNILGVACGEIMMGKATVPVLVSVGSLSTLCVWGYSRNGFHLLCKQGKGAGGTTNDDAAVPRYLAVKILRMNGSCRGEGEDDSTVARIVVTTSSGHILIFVPRTCPTTGRLIIEERERIYPHGVDGLPSPIFALDSSPRDEVVSGDKQGRLYCTSGAQLWGGLCGTLTTLIEGSPINAMLILNGASPSPQSATDSDHPSTIVAVGFDTSDLLIVSSYVCSKAVVLCRIGVGFTCIRSIAFSAHIYSHCFKTIDVLCDGEIHTISIASSDDTCSSLCSLSSSTGDAALMRRFVCASAVRGSSALVVVKQRDDPPTSYRCVVGQGMEITPCI